MIALASKPWRVDFRMHITGQYWDCRFFSTKAEADRMCFQVNTSETSLWSASRPYVDHVVGRSAEKNDLWLMVMQIEAERGRGVVHRVRSG